MLRITSQSVRNLTSIHQLSMRMLSVTRSSNNRRIPYDLEPCDIKLNDTIEKMMYDEQKEAECFLKRLELDSKHIPEILELTKTNIFQELEYMKRERISLSGYFLTQMYIAEAIDKFYCSKLPARLTKILIEFLLDRKSITSSANYIGLTDLITKRDPYFNLKNLHEVEFKSETQLFESLANDDISQYKHSHVDDSDIICDKFFEFVDFLNSISTQENMVLFAKDFILPNISAFDWLHGICSNFSNAMEYICFIIKAGNPSADVQFKMTCNPNPVDLLFVW